MHLNREPFRKIADGSKTVELRLYDERRRALRTGDVIEFCSDEGTLYATVIALHVFEDFDALYRNTDLTTCGYSREELATASPNDMLQFYSVELQRKWGVVGIELRLIEVRC